MCDYSLHLVASRAAKVGDELVTTKFDNSFTRGFAAIGEPNVAVCLLPGTEVGFEQGRQLRAHAWNLADTEAHAEGGSVPADKPGQAHVASRCAGVPRRGDRAAHPAVRRPAREGAAVAGYRAPGERRARAEARFDRQLIGLFTSHCAGRKQVDAHPRRWRLDASFAALAPTAPASVMMMELVVANNNGTVVPVSPPRDVSHWISTAVESRASAAAPSGGASTHFRYQRHIR